MMIRSLALDLDGTLIDSVPAVAAALNQLFAEDGFRQLSLDEVKTTVGPGARVMFEMALDMVGQTHDTARIDRYLERYIPAYLEDPAGSTVVYDGVRETLDMLQDQGINMGICTNKPGQTTRAVLDALDLSRYFSAIVTVDDTRYRKPDGRHVLETLTIMKADPANAVMIGDSETDIQAGQGAGLKTIAVTYGYCHVPFSELGADALIDSFALVPKILEGFRS